MHMQNNISAAPGALSTRAMLVTLSVRQWTGRKLDKRTTASVNSDAGAASDAGRYHKSLVAKDALAEIATIVGKARADHVFLSLPWMQDGTRIMPADVFTRYTAAMQSHREAFERATAAFLANYDAYAADAAARLGSLYDPADYPTRAELERRFAWSVKVLPMPDAADFRVTMADVDAERIRAEIADTMQSVFADAMADAWSRLHGVVTAMADRLAAYQPATEATKASGIFRDSLVENVRELVDVLPALNITGDARLAAMIDAARDKLTTHDAKTLREDAGARAEVREAAEQIAADMAAFMGA